MAPRARKPKKASPSMSALFSNSSASRPATVDLPAPGGPVIATRNAMDGIVAARAGRSGRGAAARPAAPFEDDEQNRDRDQLRADAEEEEVTEADLQMSDRPAEILPE